MWLMNVEKNEDNSFNVIIRNKYKDKFLLLSNQNELINLIKKYKIKKIAYKNINTKTKIFKNIELINGFSGIDTIMMSESFKDIKQFELINDDIQIKNNIITNLDDENNNSDNNIDANNLNSIFD